MKIRQGFVTNSSSSSFVLAVKQLPEVDEEVAKSHPVLKYVYKMVIDTIEGKSDDVVRTLAEYDKFISGKVYGRYATALDALIYEYDDEEGGKKLYAERAAVFNKGYTLYYLDIEYSDESLADMLRAMSDGENILFEEGYL